MLTYYLSHCKKSMVDWLIHWFIHSLICVKCLVLILNTDFRVSTLLYIMYAFVSHKSKMIWFDLSDWNNRIKSPLNSTRFRAPFSVRNRQKHYVSVKSVLYGRLRGVISDYTIPIDHLSTKPAMCISFRLSSWHQSLNVRKPMQIITELLSAAR